MTAAELAAPSLPEGVTADQVEAVVARGFVCVKLAGRPVAFWRRHLLRSRLTRWDRRWPAWSPAWSLPIADEAHRSARRWLRRLGPGGPDGPDAERAPGASGGAGRARPGAGGGAGRLHASLTPVVAWLDGPCARWGCPAVAGALLVVGLIALVVGGRS